MTLQSRLNSFNSGASQLSLAVKDIPDPPEGSELEEQIAPNWMFDFDVEQLDKINELRQRIRDAEYATDRVGAWSKILGDHIVYGNEKLADHIAIFNMGAATDCTNLGTDFCQVDEEDCYAVRNEKDFPKPRQYRRKQEILWTYLDPVSFAKAFRRHYGRKRNNVTAIRFNESGDFKTKQDVLKVDEIARRLDDIVDLFTYSASSWLDWEEAEHFTLNQSNDSRNYGARQFIVVDSVEDIPDGGIRCPHDQSDGSIQCGDCRLCIDEDAPDVYMKLF